MLRGRRPDPGGGHLPQVRQREPRLPGRGGPQVPGQWPAHGGGPQLWNVKFK